MNGATQKNLFVWAGRGGQGLPAPIWAGLIPHVPNPRPVRGADPGAGEPGRPCIGISCCDC